MSDPTEATPRVASDSERNDEAIAAYERAKVRYIRGITAESENALREAHDKRVEELNADIEQLNAVAEERTQNAQATAAAYAIVLPHRVRSRSIRPPSLWERVASFNAVGRIYRAAADASAELEELNELLRKRRDRLDTLERETRRQLYLREEAVRKKLQTPEGLKALHEDPLVRGAYARMEQAVLERAAFDERVARGEITPEAARDHDMASRVMTFAETPLSNVTISRIARYGPLEYYVLRDLQNRQSLLASDPALEPLRDVVFNVKRGPQGYEADVCELPNGNVMRVLDHLKATYGLDDALELHSMHRNALRTDKATRVTPPRNRDEAELIAMLRLLAEAVSAGSTDDL